MNHLILKKETITGLSEKNISRAFFGMLLIFISLGSIFWLNLISFSYLIFIISTILLIDYVIHCYIAWLKNYKLSYIRQVLGITSALLLALFFGLQSTQLPFKGIVLVLGVILLIPSIYTFI